MSELVAADVRVVVLVEGRSDREALAALAGRMGHSLADEGVEIVAIGGATNILRYLDAYGARGRGLLLAGLCDAGEERAFRRRLARGGLGDDLTRSQMEEIGFFVCERDLEDELIRALGVPGVEAVIEQAGELQSLRILQRQPAQRERSAEEQLRRFIGSKSGRKFRYARLFVEALDPDRIPRPLAGLLDWVWVRLPS